MRRFVLVFGGAAAVLVGCLFPSFDELKKTGAASGDDDDTGTDAGQKKDGASSSTSGSSGSSSSSSGTTTSSSSSSSSSGDASSGTVSTKAIHCSTSTTCTGDTICCSPTGGPFTCDPRATTSCNQNDIAACDGTKDCAPNQVCCQAGPGGGGSACHDGPCPGGKETYCHPADDSACPAGKSCTGSTVVGPNGFHVCE